MRDLSLLKNFFHLSDLLLKFRRNLLFVGVISIVYFYGVVDVKSIKVLDIEIPETVLNWAIPACLAWFTTNYFYYLVAEKMVWQAERLPSALDPIQYEGNTQSHGIALICADLYLRPDTVEQRNLKEFDIAALRTDALRVARFNKAMLEFHWTSRARYCFLDIAIPAIVAAAGLSKPLALLLIAGWAKAHGA